ncbi:MAG TPA: hypothetical protein VGG23_04625, partial [Acidimicrobiales bacterium]
MVDLEVSRVRASGDGTALVTLDQRGPQPRRDGSLARRHGLHVGPVTDDELEQRITEEVPGDGDRHRADAVDLAPFVAFDRATLQRGQVDAEMDLGFRLRRRIAADDPDERVGQVRDARFSPAGRVGLLEHRVGLALDDGQHAGTVNLR